MAIAIFPLGDEHALAGGRREGDGEEELRVVGDAQAVGEVGPSPVEDELALAVRLQVRGRGGDEAVLASLLLHSGATSVKW